MKRILVLLALAITFTSCSKISNNADTNTVELNGKLEAIGITTFQYGTHKIKVDEKTYALKSSVFDLNTYEGKAVTLKGSKVEGYPVENGPELIEVTKIDINTTMQN